jgi:hypothetical protein
MQAERGLKSPPVSHGFRYTSHEKLTAFVNNPQSRWVSLSGDMFFLKGNEQRLVPLVHRLSKRNSQLARELEM